MNFEAVTLQGVSPQQQPGKSSDEISMARKKKEGSASEETVAKKEIQSEEVLDQIKSLTEDGLYSVRFENNQDTGQMVVKIVDQETDEVIRQVPAEEILELREMLDDLRGNIVDTQG